MKRLPDVHRLFAGTRIRLGRCVEERVAAPRTPLFVWSLRVDRIRDVIASRSVEPMNRIAELGRVERAVHRCDEVVDRKVTSDLRWLTIERLQLFNATLETVRWSADEGSRGY